MMQERFFQFLHNVLINACDMSYVEEAHGTLELLQHLDRFLRYYSSKKEQVTIGQELNILKDYIFITRMKQGNSCHITIEQSPYQEDRTIQKFSIIGIMDEMIQESNERNSDYTTYTISLVVEEKVSLLIEVKNNVGIKKNTYLLT